MMNMQLGRLPGLRQAKRIKRGLPYPNDECRQLLQLENGRLYQPSNKNIPKLNFDVSQQLRSSIGDCRGEVSRRRGPNRGSQSLQARYEHFLNQPFAQQEPRLEAKADSCARSWLMSSIATDRGPLGESVELPSIRRLDSSANKACFCNSKPSKSAFALEMVIGRGGYGKVWKVRHRKSGEQFAMKEIEKTLVVQTKSLVPVMNQLRLLSRIHHPFLINAHYAFQDSLSLYLVLDYANCGDLRYHIIKHTQFSEEQSRFFVCCILLGLEYLHSQEVIHRDLKPENLVFDSKGYLRITDFGISRDRSAGKQTDTSGTLGYMAPEVITRRSHSYECDYFALGVIAHELMLGKRPYTGKSRYEIRDQMILKPANIEKAPKGWSTDAIDFVHRLLSRKPARRLGGAGGCKQIKSHSWLQGFNWNALNRLEMVAPYTPQPIESDYSSYYDENICPTVTPKDPMGHETALLLKSAAVQSLFEGYDMNIDQENVETPSWDVAARKKNVRCMARKQ